MNELKGQVGEVRMTIGIKRKATGKMETYELVGKIIDQKEEPKDGSHTFNGSERRGD